MGTRCPALGPSPSAETVIDLIADVDGVVALRIAVKALLYAACLLAAGSAVFHAVHRTDAATERRTRHVATTTAALGVALSGFVVLGEVLFLVGGDWAAARDPMLWGVVLDTPIGDAQAWRGAGLVLVALLALGQSMRWPAAIGAVLVAASFAMVGHSLREPRAALALLVVLHVLTAAYWLGAFAPLHHAARTLAPSDAGALAEDFGRKALAGVAVLVAAGAGLLVVLAGGPLAVLASDWGRLLAVKLVLVAGLLALAARNKRHLSPALSRGDEAAAAALRGSIRREVGLVALVLLATAAMTSTASPPENAALMVDPILTRR